MATASFASRTCKETQTAAAMSEMNVVTKKIVIDAANVTAQVERGVDGDGEFRLGHMQSNSSSSNVSERKVVIKCRQSRDTMRLYERRKCNTRHVNVPFRY